MSTRARDVLINIGFGNVVFLNKIVSIVVPTSAPLKRLREDARQNNMLVDATSGRKTRSMIITESNHIILSALQSETLVQRVNSALMENLLDK
jgi:extracellular matrix regulatory protein A